MDWDTPNWEREKPNRFWDPSRKLILSIRDYQEAERTGGTLSYFKRIISVLRHRFWSAISGAEITLSCNLGGGLLIPHPNGIVIHPSSEVGNNCLIFQQVTLAGTCILGNHVDIGAGAKIIGPVSIGSNTKIGANAVVTSDVPSNCTAVGIPARIIPHDI